MNIAEAIEKIRELDEERDSLIAEWVDHLRDDGLDYEEEENDLVSSMNYIKGRMRHVESHIKRLYRQVDNTEEQTKVSVDCEGTMITKSLQSWLQCDWRAFNCSLLDIKKAVNEARANTELVE